jgi:acetamidase/formamidase
MHDHFPLLSSPPTLDLLVVKKSIYDHTVFLVTKIEIVYEIRYNFQLGSSLEETHHVDDCVVIALRDMIALICRRTNLSREQAYTLCSLAADLRVTQVVNGNKGIHVMLEKKLLNARPRLRRMAGVSAHG